MTRLNLYGMAAVIALILASTSAMADPDIPYELTDRAEDKRVWIHTVELDKKAKLNLTIGCQSIRESKPMRLSFQIFRVTKSGGEVEVRKYSIEKTSNMARTTGKVDLPAGTYRVRIEAEWCEFVTLLVNR